jgi:hypothetical protein
VTALVSVTLPNGDDADLEVGGWIEWTRELGTQLDSAITTTSDEVDIDTLGLSAADMTLCEEALCDVMATTRGAA